VQSFREMSSVARFVISNARGLRTQAISRNAIAAAATGSHFSTVAATADDPQLNETIQLYGRKRQTNVSLRALLDTGSGTFIDKIPTKGLVGASATEQVLVQVR
jgi:hypothetical protein